MKNRIKLNYKVIILISIVFLSIVSIYFLWNVILPFFTGLVLAYLLDPLVRYLENNRYFNLKRLIAITLIFLVFITCFIYIAIILFHVLQPQAILTLAKDLSHYGKFIQNEYVKILKELKVLGLEINPEGLIQPILNQIESFFTYFFSSLRNIFTGILNSAVFLILVPLSTFYFLKDKHKIFQNFKKFFLKNHEEQLHNIYILINKKIVAYLIALLLTSFMVGISVSIFLLFFESLRPYAFLFGIIAGIANIIPYFGPFIGGVPLVIVSLVQLPFNDLLVVIIFLILLNIIIGLIIYPKITASQVNIHPLAVLIAIFTGNTIYGILGMLFAVPITIVMKSIFKFIFEQYIQKI